MRLQCLDGNVSDACEGADCGCWPAWRPGLPARRDLPIGRVLIPSFTVGGVLCILGGLWLYHWLRRGQGRAESAAAAAESPWAGDGDGPNEVVVESAVPLPLYWATKDGVHIFPDPNRMDEMQRLMTDTWRVCFTRDRRLVAGARKVPIGCRVANVLRIENYEGYERYWQYKAKVAERRASGGCEPFRTLTHARLNALDSDVNEMYLFHGTNPESAHSIARDLFRIDKAGSCGGAMFGPGIYLAENASKSDEYAKEGSGVYLGLCAMLVCRVTAGRVHTVASSGDYSARVRNGDYDSLCGDRLAAAGTFREMVLFDEDAVYAEFIVIYARVYGDD